MVVIVDIDSWSTEAMQDDAVYIEATLLNNGVPPPQTVSPTGYSIIKIKPLRSKSGARWMGVLCLESPDEVLNFGGGDQ